MLNLRSLCHLYVHRSLCHTLCTWHGCNVHCMWHACTGTYTCKNMGLLCYSIPSSFVSCIYDTTSLFDNSNLDWYQLSKHLEDFPNALLYHRSLDLNSKENVVTLVCNSVFAQWVWLGTPMVSDEAVETLMNLFAAIRSSASRHAMHTCMASKVPFMHNIMKLPFVQQ